MSIIEKALLEAEQLEETMKSNAKEILSSTMKEEINELVKESLDEENDYLKEQGDVEKEVDMDIDMDSNGDDMGMEMELDIDGGIELPPLDLTSASDEEVLRVFKAMGSEDGIIVQKDDNEDISFIDGDDEWLIKLDENKKSMKKTNVNEMEEPMYEIEMDDMGEMYDMDEMEHEPMYEIELDEESGEHSHITTHNHGDVIGVDDPESEEGLEDFEDEPTYEIELDTDEPEQEMEEMVRQNNLGQKVHAGNRTNKYNRDSRKHSGIHLEHRDRSKGRVLQENYHLLKEEVSTLKNKNGEYRKALVTFKEKLNEVGVFNSNLAYATRLFTEHSTTKPEKINILRRFDNVSSLKESKGLYKILREEFSQNKSTKSKKTISETVDRKINSTPTSGMDKRLMKETKAYENPQFSRIKDLMSKL
tara:strand:+ start:7273 stop:8529 length:1257 start_codon:yes stop_codon:yes gene_type:complete